MNPPPVVPAPDPTDPTDRSNRSDTCRGAIRGQGPGKPLHEPSFALRATEGRPEPATAHVAASRTGADRRVDPPVDPSPCLVGCQEWLRRPGRLAAFSLIELLVVLGIIGILAALSLPAMRGLGRANQVDSAAQQLADDLALARARAINGRTTVHVVFVPTNILSINAGPSTYAQSVKERLLDGPYRAYGFFADRSVGDQPGRPTPYYMDDWRALPEGVLLAPYEYVPAPPGNWQAIDPLTRPLGWISIPFPTVESGTNWVPHMSFGPEGGLVDEQGNRVFGVDYIELRKGSILSQRDAGGGLIYHDVRHDPTNNAPPIRIRVDGFTGKAQIERPEIQ